MSECTRPLSRRGQTWALPPTRSFAGRWRALFPERPAIVARSPTANFDRRVCRPRRFLGSVWAGGREGAVGRSVRGAAQRGRASRNACALSGHYIQRPARCTGGAVEPGFCTGRLRRR